LQNFQRRLRCRRCDRRRSPGMAGWDWLPPDTGATGRHPFR
jgi:hypothetical protein